MRPDFNGDGIVNSIDYSILNSKWFTADPVTDLNRDGITNSIDYSLLGIESIRRASTKHGHYSASAKAQRRVLRRLLADTMKLLSGG